MPSACKPCAYPLRQSKNLITLGAMMCAQCTRCLMKLFLPPVGFPMVSPEHNNLLMNKNDCGKQLKISHIYSD